MNIFKEEKNIGLIVFNIFRLYKNMGYLKNCI